MGNETDKRWKGRKIDWLEIADMDSADYELKPLNQQQVAILLMLLDYQKWETRWENLELTKDELQRFIGDIEERLMRDEGINMTPEELTEAICNGLVCAAPKIGLMLASGAASGNTFDEDGNIVTPDTGGDSDAGLPEDDPETPLIDETLAAKAGGVIAINVGISEIWSKMDTWFGVDNSADITQEEMVERLGNLYIWESDVELESFVAVYYIPQGLGQVVPTSWATSVQSPLFCKGRTKQVMNEWIYDTLTGNEQQLSLALVQALSLEQIEVWYEYGIQAQSTNYIGYSCTKIATESGSHNFALSNAPQFTTAGVWKAGHRFLIKTSGGTFTDVDNPNIIYDAMYEHNTSTGVKTFKPMTFISNGGVPNPAQANVPFAADHIYEFTVDKSPSVANGTCVVQGDNGSAGLPNTTGGYTFEIIDLGEFSL